MALDGGEVITIDGPSGAGKSTISRRLAARLGYTYLDTGAMYRAVGLYLRGRGLEPEDAVAPETAPDVAPEAAMKTALEAALDELHLELVPAVGDDDVGVKINGEDVSAAIRSPEMALVASRISAVPLVRRKLTELQRQVAARAGGLVAEGRDMGTVVFPEARAKFYLDATPEERARRRSEQLRQRGQSCDDREILDQIRQRDQADSQRALAPLRPAEDAVIIDSSRLGLAEVVAAMLAEIKKSTNSG